MSASATSTYGSTDAGFVPRQLADIQRAINERLALVVDPVSGEYPFQNASDDTILQQVVAILAEEMMFTENAAAWAFLMRDPLSAVGAALSSLVQLNGITRNAGSRTNIPMILEGDPGTLVPKGTLFAENGGAIAFALNEDVVIPLSGTAVMGASATALGPIDVEAGTVVVIQTPVGGLRRVVNGSPTAIGTDGEEDAALRKRQQHSTNATSYRQIEAIRGAVLNVEGVTFCRAYQNSDLETDERGVPGKTLACVAVGGDDMGIASAIFFRSPLGIRYAGNVTKTFRDNQGIYYPVSFARPTERLISVRVLLDVVNDEGIQVFPDDGIQRIKEAIIEFAEAGHTVCEPLGNTGFPPGQDIIRSYLFTPINSIGGAEIVRLELAVDGGGFAEENIVIAWNEHGVFSEDRIEVDFT